MPVDDRTRLNLHRTLERTLGSRAADALMDHLPPVTWNQVATKDDLDHLGTTLRGEMKMMTSELRGEMTMTTSELRGEMHVGFAELRGEMQGLRTEFVEASNRQLKWLVTFAAAWSSLLLAAARLLP